MRPPSGDGGYFFGQRHMLAWAIWRRKIIVAIRCQAVENFN